MTTTPVPTSPRHTRALWIVLASGIAGLALAAGAYFALTAGGASSLFGSPSVSVANGASREELTDAVIGRWGTADDGSHHYELLADGTGSRSVRDGDGRVDFTWYITDDGALGLRNLPAMPDEDWAISVRHELSILRFEDPDRPGWSMSLSRHESAPTA